MVQIYNERRVYESVDSMSLYLAIIISKFDEKWNPGTYGLMGKYVH